MQYARRVMVAVLICVALEVGFALILTRHAAEHASLRDLGHQAVLIAAAARTSVSYSSYLLPLRHSLQRQHELALVHAEILPVHARQLLHHGEPAQGTVTYQGAAYDFAARPVNGGHSSFSGRGDGAHSALTRQPVQGSFRNTGLGDGPLPRIYGAC